MEATDDVYRSLQKYLDANTIGFPATESGSDIRLLKQLFTPKQAKAVMCLTYKAEPIGRIYERADDPATSIEDFETLLYEAAKKGLILYQKKDGERYYKNRPYIVGFYEGQVDNLTPEFRSAHNAYFADGAFPMALLSTKASQMRTIPIQQSITPEHHVSHYDEIKGIIENTDGPLAILECICRKEAELDGNPCQKTSRKETCMALGFWASSDVEFGRARQITKAEALEILKQNEEDGLVLQPNNTQKPEFICSCCGCCCGMLRMQSFMPRPLDYWSSNYYAQVDSEACTACETCIETCQVDAIRLSAEDTVATIDLERCIGCGNCVPACPTEAMALVKKEAEEAPPETPDDLHDFIIRSRPASA